MKKDPIKVVPPKPGWAEEGYEYAERAATALGDLVMRVDHVGSTAVQGLAAKDVIDIQALVFRLDDPGIIERLVAAGFRHDGQNANDPPLVDTAEVLGADDWRKVYFREPKGQRRVHLHVRRNGAANARNTLLLRDYLRDEAAARRDYGEFKMALAAVTKTNREAYQAIKTPFIATALRAAEGWAELTRWTPGAPDVYWRSGE
jgi:dephospho-CoA kinase